MRTAAVILAAGESRRMGRPKAYLPFRSGTFLSVLADTFGEWCSPVIAVFGFDGANAAGQAPANVVPVINPDYRLGMLTSLQTGLRALEGRFDRVLFTLVDHPAVERDTVASLMRSTAEIAIPRFEGKRGHPVLMRRERALEYLSAPVSAKVRDVIDRHADAIEYFDCKDPGVRDDVDDPAVYEALLAREASRA